MSPTTTPGVWPLDLPTVQMRFARPTSRLDEVARFYGEVLGLPLLHRSEADGWPVVLMPKVVPLIGPG